MSRAFTRWSTGVLLAGAVLATPVVIMTAVADAPLPRRDPTGTHFPTVVGRSPGIGYIELPTAFDETTTVMVVGYRKRAAGDIGRWMRALVRANVEELVVKVATIPALLPAQEEGSSQWGSVVALVGVAGEPVARLTGTQPSGNARVLVLDRAGCVLWFDDGGFAEHKVDAIAALVDGAAGS